MIKIKVESSKIRMNFNVYIYFCIQVNIVSILVGNSWTKVKPKVILVWTFSMSVLTTHNLRSLMSELFPPPGENALIIKFSIQSVACKRIIMFSKFYFAVVSMSCSFSAFKNSVGSLFAIKRRTTFMSSQNVTSHPSFVSCATVSLLTLGERALAPNIWLLKCSTVNKNIYYLLQHCFFAPFALIFYEVDTMRNINMTPSHALILALQFDEKRYQM